MKITEHIIHDVLFDTAPKSELTQKVW
jgi:hypothetical protein